MPQRNVFLLLLLPFSSALLPQFPIHNTPRKSTAVYSSMEKGGKTSSVWISADEGVGNIRDSSVKLSEDVVEKLNQVLGTLVTSCAIDTVSSYMLEFRDSASEKWMLNFDNYKEEGFEDGLWTNYIEKMILLDKEEVEVHMKPNSALLRGKRIPPGANIVFQYFMDLEPRKIAHQIITVREDVSAEIIQDLGCILLENDEAVRFSASWVNDGREAALVGRKVDRVLTNSFEGGHTPNRDRNYMQFNILITNLAIDLLRKELRDRNERDSLAAIDTVLEKIIRETEAKEFAEGQLPIYERFEEMNFGPRTFIEELYYKGLTEGVAKVGTRTVNILKVAQDLLAMRHALARETAKLMSLQSLQNRYYYKMIKDLGGFQKLDLGKGKSHHQQFKMLDLDSVEYKAILAAEEAEKAAAKKVREEAKLRAKEEARVKAEELERVNNPHAQTDGDGSALGREQSAELSEEDEGINLMDFGGFGGGPMMM